MLPSVPKQCTVPGAVAEPAGLHQFRDRTAPAMVMFLCWNLVALGIVSFFWHNFDHLRF